MDNEIINIKNSYPEDYCVLGRMDCRKLARIGEVNGVCAYGVSGACVFVVVCPREFRGGRRQVSFFCGVQSRLVCRSRTGARPFQ